MRFVSAVLLMLLTGAAHAGLGDSLRELRGTIGEMTSTSREVGELSKEVTPTKSPDATKAESVTTTEIKSGDTIVAKMDKVKVLKEANKKSAKLLQLSKTDEVIYMGEEQNGMYRVTTSEGEGWVDKLLVKKP
ncbi:MAG TPA: hypothetical protein PL131_10430 [Methylotenera sp.]|nr:hypothetical protein [Methylotenera sp.]HPH06281.1 hypothetical protein [Methylotenera sp.]HPN00373.1 hypothetical protein [Methylotenera sp.]